MRYDTARKILMDRGLKFNRREGNREYWWFGDGTDTLLDHSATITYLGEGMYHPSVFF